MGGAAGVASGAPVVTVSRPIGAARISGGVAAGMILSKKSPVYPPVAKVMHMGGRVVMRAIITKSGTIDSLQIISTTSPIFDLSAIDAVRSWVYKPYILNGQPTEVDTTITVNYNLNGG